MLFIVDNQGIPSREGVWVHLIDETCGTPGMMGFSPGGLAGSNESLGVRQQVLEGHPITMEFREPGTGAVLAVYTQPMRAPGALGRITTRKMWVNLPEGQYEVYVRPYLNWLGRKQVVQWSRDCLVSFSLVNGDANGDNRVDSLDLTQVGLDAGLRGVNLASDLNKDGRVDELDTQIVRNDLGAVGDR